MPGVITFLDSCALINAFRGSDQAAARLISIIEDPNREFISTSIIKLEILPKPTAYKNRAELEFYNLLLNAFPTGSRPMSR